MNTSSSFNSNQKLANPLELEVLSVISLSFFPVSNISVSEILPRSTHIIFVNVTTLEGESYCLELTQKGWRIASLQTDSMHGDFTRIELFIVYYNSIHDLLKNISPIYKSQMSSSKFDSLLKNYNSNDKKKNYLFCSNCSYALAPVKSLQSKENLKKKLLTNTNVSACNSCNSFSNCRCKLKDCDSDISNQSLKEKESEKFVFIERYCLLNNQVKTDKCSQKLNYSDSHVSSSSNDNISIIDENNAYNYNNEKHNTNSVCSSNSSLTSNFSSE